MQTVAVVLTEVELSFFYCLSDTWEMSLKFVNF